MDLGAGENPFGLKRKIKLGTWERDIIFSLPESEYEFTLDLSENFVLEFGIGIIRDANSEKRMESEKDEEEGVNFLIALEIEGRKKTIFQDYLSPPLHKEERTLSSSRHTIDLPYNQKNARLYFITKGGDHNFSFWLNPLLYDQGKTTRNIILISIDTLRADHLGCYGYERNTSPNVDALALDSAQFLNTYASAPWTLPSHVSILTSLHGVHHQVYYSEDKMDPSLITLSELLKQNHFYNSAFTGGGFVSSVYGFSKGFDTYEEGVGGVFKQDSVERVYSAVSEWLDYNKDKNFFLFLHTYQPHTPYACPAPYKGMFLEENAKWRHLDLFSALGGRAGIFKSLPEEDRQNIISLYDSEIRYTDEKLVGPLVEKLKEMDLYDQTMIIFTSDHGEEFYDHKGWGHGHSIYDESLKVPLLVKFPESKFKGKRIENIVSLVDIMPTILEEMNIDFSGLDIDGKSLFPVLKGREKGDRVFFADIGSNILNSHIPQKTAMNIGKNKLIFNKRFDEKDLEYFLYPPPSLNPVELYDLQEDPQETMDKSNQRVELANRIIRQINEIYSMAKKRKIEKAIIDEKIKEQLRALGYIE